MRHLRRAKIVATLGPATSSVESIHALFESGVDVFRFNFSHGSQEDHARRYRVIRKLERETGRPIGILADLQGPKLRIATFERGEARLYPGSGFTLDRRRRPGDETRVCLPHAHIFKAVEVGDELLLDDGRIRLVVRERGPETLRTEVVEGGRLGDRKGVNLPGATLPISALTAKDRDDLRFALDLGCDWIALSFVQRPGDVRKARALVDGRAHVLAKIEKPSALARIEEVVAEADAVMVARGDLGVEMAPEDVPLAQKTILRAARDAGKPAIVATQMLESMTSAPIPTRAEISDVATAVFDGADAVMLSAETAMGDYPIESVSIMDRAIARFESDPLHREIMEAAQRPPLSTPADAISTAARQVADTIDAAAIVTYTTSGSTTFRAARTRPAQPILGLTSDLATARRLSLLCGVHSVHTADVRNFAEMVRKATSTAVREKLASPGQAVVMTAGVPFGTPGATNILRIAWVEEGAE